MSKANPLQLAQHIDRIRRLTTPLRLDVHTLDLPGDAGGWISWKPGTPPATFPSASIDRVYWLAPQRVLTKHDIDAAASAMRAAGIQQGFWWLAPWAWDDAVEAALTAVGAARWPYVEYVALARPAEHLDPPRPANFHAQIFTGQDARETLAQCAAWYSDLATADAQSAVERASTETHVLFDGPRPIALALLTHDAPHHWAYLSAARTHPDYLRRGAQAQLIATRVTRAADLGAQWCACETNTMVPISLRNLIRSGFAPAIAWRVYGWKPQ